MTEEAADAYTAQLLEALIDLELRLAGIARWYDLAKAGLPPAAAP